MEVTAHVVDRRPKLRMLSDYDAQAELKCSLLSA